MVGTEVGGEVKMAMVQSWIWRWQRTEEPSEGRGRDKPREASPLDRREFDGQTESHGSDKS